MVNKQMAISQNLCLLEYGFRIGVDPSLNLRKIHSAKSRCHYHVRSPKHLRDEFAGASWPNAWAEKPPNPSSQPAGRGHKRSPGWPQWTRVSASVLQYHASEPRESEGCSSRSHLVVSTHQTKKWDSGLNMENPRPQTYPKRQHRTVK